MDSRLWYFGSAGGTPGTSNFNYTTGGVIAGVDTKVTDDTLIGGAVAYDHTDDSVSSLGFDGTIDAYRVTLYGSQSIKTGMAILDPVIIDGNLGYGYNNYQDSRAIVFPGVSRVAESKHNGNDYTADLGVSHPLGFQSVTFVPRVGIEYDIIGQDAYTESGAGDVSLATGAITLNALRSTIGGKAFETFHTSGGTVLSPEVRASWAHDFLNVNVPETVAFVGAPTTPFSVTGVNPGRDAALVGLGLTSTFTNKLSAFADYDAVVRPNETDHVMSIGVRYSW